MDWPDFEANISQWMSCKNKCTDRNAKANKSFYTPDQTRSGSLYSIHSLGVQLSRHVNKPEKAILHTPCFHKADTTGEVIHVLYLLRGHA
jgi:hypothetical protein